MPSKKYDEYEFKYNEEEITRIEQYENMVYRIWSTLRDNWIKKSYRNELISAGFRGLCYATKLWEPERGSFETYCPIYIRHSMYIECRKIIRLSKMVRSLDEPIYNNNDDEEEVLGDKIPSSVDIEDEAISKVTAEELQKIVEEVCTERQKKILDMYCNSFMSYSEIAKELGISRERIRQMMDSARKKILRKYRKGLDN